MIHYLSLRLQFSMLMVVTILLRPCTALITDQDSLRQNSEPQFIYQKDHSSIDTLFEKLFDFKSAPNATKSSGFVKRDTIDSGLLTCRVVALVDQSFAAYYQSRAPAYIQTLYAAGNSFYSDAAGINIQLDRIIYLTPQQSASIYGSTINQELTLAGNLVRSGGIDVRTSNPANPNPCLVHVLTYRKFEPTLGLSYVSPNPGPVVVEPNGRDVPVPATGGVGGVCAPLGWNVFVTSFLNQGKEIPLQSAVETVLHEIGHTLGAVHRDQCCSNIPDSLGITSQNLDANRQQWLLQTQQACQTPQSVIADGKVARDVMTSDIAISSNTIASLGLCARGMILRNVNRNRQTWTNSGCLTVF